MIKSYKKISHLFKGISSKKVIAFLLSFLLLISNINYVFAMSVTEQNQLLGANTPEWESSNLREWLNTETSKVNYTGLSPTYKDEKGFLADGNFTQAERNGITVTRHSGMWQYSLGGNVNNTKYVSQRSIAGVSYQNNDKVFILGYYELMNYIERNKKLFEMNTKNYSNYLQYTTNRKDKYEYLVNSGYYNGGYINTNVLYTSLINEIRGGNNPQNIVPTLSLKPNYTLPNGVIAKNLVIGNTVSFGKYNNEPIEWQVINKFDNGSPLLWSTKILTIKEYDSPGDKNPAKSNYINFPSYDVDTTTNLGQNKSWENKLAINSVPVINIDNESVLTTPTNNTSLTITIRVTDSYHNIRKITLPDGTTTTQNPVSFTLTKNGEFDIVAENSQGVISVRHIVTKAINTPAKIVVSTDKDPNNKWTNKSVNVDVRATNDGAYIAKTIKKDSGYGSISSPQFANWMSLGGKRARITGTLYDKIKNEDIVKHNLDMSAKIDIRYSHLWYNINQIGWTWPVITSVSLNELKNKGQVSIDETFYLPNNVYQSLYTSVQLMADNTPYMREGYSFGMSEFTIEILDKDDLEIKEIGLPNGSIVYGKTAKYVIHETGTYPFWIKDNRGKTDTQSVEVAIDKVAPSAEIIYPTAYTTENLVLNIIATDNASGIRSVKLPNGELRANTKDGLPLSIPYNVFNNGTYSFVITDFAGNSITKTAIVNNIDRVKPTLTLTPNTTSWTNQDVSITVDAKDIGSGIKEVKTQTGIVASGNFIFKATQNGTYAFTAYDKAGNLVTQSIPISNIDKIKPTGSFTINNGATQTNNRNVTLRVTHNDNLSGVNQIKVTENGVSKTFTPTGNLTTIPWTVSPSAGKKTFTVTLYDRAGNETTLSNSIVYTNLEIQGLTLNNVINPNIFNSKNPFTAKQWVFSPQQMSAGGNISFSVQLSNPVDLPSFTDKVSSITKVTYPNGTVRLLNNNLVKVSGTTYNTKVTIPSNAPKNSKVELLITANRQTSEFSETVYYPSKESSTNYAHIGNVTNNIHKDIRFNEIK